MPRVTAEEILEILETPFIKENFPDNARDLYAEDTERKVYSILREIRLERFDVWWAAFTSTDGPIYAHQAQMKIEEVERWLKRPEVVALDAALEIIEGTKSKRLKEAAISLIGKYSSRGQPVSKRYLAVIALDAKCLHPDLTLRMATGVLCQCGSDTHTFKCRERLRQQINLLVRFLRGNGHDFTWERLSKIDKESI